MELTESAFNILLDMTAQPLLSRSRAENQSAENSTRSAISISEPSRKVRRPATPTIHYHNGSHTTKISNIEIVDKICEAPEGTHLLWCAGNERWRSWRELPKLHAAVNAKLTAREAHSSQVAEVSQALTKAKPLPTEHLKANSKQVVTQSAASVRALHHSDYLSVPETTFTRFELELRDSDRVKPFVGLDGDIAKGGLFIATSRVLHVGDYIQVTLTHRGKVAIKFEAPISWLRWPDDRSEFSEGVAVYWPKLSASELRLITHITDKEGYEFFVA